LKPFDPILNLKVVQSLEEIRRRREETAIEKRLVLLNKELKENKIKKSLQTAIEKTKTKLGVANRANT